MVKACQPQSLVLVLQDAKSESDRLQQQLQGQGDKVGSLEEVLDAMTTAHNKALKVGLTSLALVADAASVLLPVCLILCCMMPKC